MSVESCPLKGTCPRSRHVTVQNVSGMPPFGVSLGTSGMYFCTTSVITNVGLLNVFI